MQKNTPINPLLKIFLPGIGERVKGVEQFYKVDYKRVHKLLVESPPDFWEKKGKEMAFNLFHAAAQRVPAYKDFLGKHGISHEQIRTIADFRNVPVMDKDNYMRAYPLPTLCWGGKLEDSTLFSVSSGSSGKPFFWPRGDNLEIETSITHGLMLSEFFGVRSTKTLFVDSFSMGIYIAGVVILNSALRASQTGMPLTIITPGVEMDDALRVMEELGPHYEQVILAGYPPFVKDIIDAGIARGIDWRAMRVKFLFAAENFSEQFREYLLEKVGGGDVIHSSFNIYGSAEASIMAHETPLTIAMRRAAVTNSALFRDLFGESSYIPTFVQYNPALKFFEEEGRELLLSCYGGSIPLIRYNFHDSGKQYSFEDVLGRESVRAVPDFENLHKASWKLPFLCVAGKSDLTISLYGLKIYPENIKAGLEDPRLREIASGKFVMQQKYRVNQDQYWELAVELKEGVEGRQKIAEVLKDIVMEALWRNNLEFKRLHAAIGEKAEPEIVLCAKDDPRYFSGKSVKQRWTKT